MQSGLFDKNGKHICVNNIAKITYDGVSVIGIIKYENGEFLFVTVNSGVPHYLDMVYDQDFEVIGNIGNEEKSLH